MIVARDLDVHGTEAQIAAFVREMSGNPPGGWHRAVDLEANILEMGPIYVGFEREPMEKGYGVVVWLMYKSAEWLRCVNITPVGRGSIDDFGEVNFYLEEWCRVASPYAERHGVRFEMTTDRKDLEDWVPADAVEALRVFAKCADPESGNATPEDRAMWHRFVFLAYRGGAKTESDWLYRWLSEEMRWDEDTARTLSFEYETALEMLKDYDVWRASGVVPEGAS